MWGEGEGCRGFNQTSGRRVCLIKQGVEEGGGRAGAPVGELTTEASTVAPTTNAARRQWTMVLRTPGSPPSSPTAAMTAGRLSSFMRRWRRRGWVASAVRMAEMQMRVVVWGRERGVGLGEVSPARRRSLEKGGGGHSRCLMHRPPGRGRRPSEGHEAVGSPARDGRATPERAPSRWV